MRMPNIIDISVRGIVELVLRSGSIDSRYISAKRAYEGVMIHQKLQKKRKDWAKLTGASYEKEVVLKKRFKYEGFEFIVHGRADGLIIYQESDFIVESEISLRNEFIVESEIGLRNEFNEFIVESEINLRSKFIVELEEIKSTSLKTEDITSDPEHWHWAQLKCYGYMYASENGLEEITLRLTYCNIESEQTTEFENRFGLKELTAYFYQLIELYLAFARVDKSRITERDATIDLLTFPFKSYRKNQREFAAEVYRTIRDHGMLFAQAPTGTGKTISTVFPAIKALGAGLCSKIFYLTAKTTTRQSAHDSLLALEEKGLIMRGIVLTAKDKICFNPGYACNPISCKYADGHFDRVNAAVLDIIKSETIITGAVIASYAQRYNICPFEFELDIAGFCDFIVCDYNHVYDPGVRLRRFFDDKNDFCLLIDEAHNLIDRAREMFSAEISTKDFRDVNKLFQSQTKESDKKEKKIIKPSMIRYMNKAIAGLKTPERTEMRELLADFAAEADKWLAASEGCEQHAGVMELYFKVLDYLRIDDFFDDNYEFFVSSSKYSASVKLLCLDPSRLLGKVHSRTGSVAMFSATLSPPGYFMDVLGALDNSRAVSIPSPFDKSNLAVLIDVRVSARYAERAASYDIIARDLHSMVIAKKGNYLAFFPSYEYLDKVYARFNEIFTDTFEASESFDELHIPPIELNHKYKIETLKQTGSMSEQERSVFLERFNANNINALLGFAVMGGVFSEGIDLVGDRLIGAAIISVGLPLVTSERDLLAEYYKEKLGRGFEYAYVYPGMTRVTQAAGRVIRSDTDRGVLLLLDSRFMQYTYRSLFPQGWEDAHVIKDDAGLDSVLNNFWKTDTETNELMG